jgi:hypothetical protein
MNPTSCLYTILFSCWLAHFLLVEKIAKRLHYFGLDCGMLEFLKHSTTSGNPKISCRLAGIFGARFGGKDVVCGHTKPDPNKQEVGFIFV